ncbi:hypothetical protein [Spiroplasma culicicola]|uniref:Lipoprotein n=1 Tax=Spiroplasma culicicola AES-1 TaxID=1276246 RepID=W6A6Z8_9MOLU|nr:hypothetical protein [Spiroplasma culicicola]AHI52650.1 hypothetical protein SCULI_v1c03090 [Spiroplasma culicicola AES-1]
MKKLLMLLSIAPLSAIGATVVACDPVPFVINIDLEKDIEQTELGEIIFTKDEIENIEKRSTKLFNKIVEKNSKIKKDYAKYFLIEIAEDKAILRANPEYEENVSGTSTFTYEAIQEKQNLKDLIKVTALGEFSEEPNEQEIFDKVEELNSTTIGDLTFDDVTIAIINKKATITAKEENKDFTGSVSVNWTLEGENVEPTDIADLIKVTALGQFDETPSEQVIFDKVEELNSTTIGDLSFGDVTIVITGEKAKISAASDSFTGTVEVTWTVAVPAIDIADLIKVTALGQFGETPSEQEIFDKVEELNSTTIGDLTFGDVTIAIAGEKAEISAASESFTGTVEVTWTVAVPAIDIADLIKATALGEFGETPSEQEIWDKVEELNSTTIGDLTFGDVTIVITGEKAKISAASDSFTGTVEVTWTVAVPAIDIADLIKVTALGQFGETPSEQEIFDKVEELNSTTIGDLSFGDVTIAIAGEKAEISAASESFTGTVEVTWTVAVPAIDIADLIKATALGEFGETPSEQEIWDKVEELNSTTIGDLTFGDVTIVITGEKAKISAASDSFTGTVEVTWTVAVPAIDIADLIKVTALGQFGETPSEQEIFDKVEELNSTTIGDLTFGDVTIAIAGEKAEISAASESFTGTVEVTWTVAVPATDINELIDEKELGEFPADIDEETIFNKFIELNENLKDKISFEDVDVEITEDGKATITVKSENEQYTGSVDVTWTITDDSEEQPE